MEPRPKIKLTLSPLDNTLELTSKIFLFFMWSLTLYIFIKLPTIIPIHFNATGKADNYGNKKTLLILPLIATIIYFAITQLSKRPHILNYMTTITKDNAEKEYTRATRTLRFLKLIILIIFSLIILLTYLTSSGVTNGLGFWFLPMTFGLLFIPTVISIYQSFMKKNKVVWKVRTHNNGFCASAAWGCINHQ